MFPLLGYQRRFYFHKFGHYLHPENRYKIQHLTNEEEKVLNRQEANKQLLQTLAQMQKKKGRRMRNRGGFGVRGQDRFTNKRKQDRGEVRREERDQSVKREREEKPTTWVGEQIAAKKQKTKTVEVHVKKEPEDK